MGRSFGYNRRSRSAGNLIHVLVRTSAGQTVLVHTGTARGVAVCGVSPADIGHVLGIAGRETYSLGMDCAGSYTRCSRLPILPGTTRLSHCLPNIDQNSFVTLTRLAFAGPQRSIHRTSFHNRSAAGVVHISQWMISWTGPPAVVWSFDRRN